MDKDYRDDSFLLERLKNHDVKAYEFLYISARKRLLVLAVSIVNDQETAKDLVHEMFEEFWENRAYENIKISLKSYLYNSMRYKALRHVRGQHSYFRVVEDLEALEENDTLFPLENSELKKEIDAAIEKLPTMAGKVFTMHYVQQMTHAEISAQLGIAKSTVSSHIDRALKELRISLKKTL
jgi:RNA polymerase sigma factor (sigma-70 family)